MFLIVRDFCQPVYEAWLTEAVAIGRLDAPGFFADPVIKAAHCNANWHGPTMSILDPVKDITGSALRVQYGYSTREHEAAEMTGTDFEENLDQLLKINQPTETDTTDAAQAAIDDERKRIADLDAMKTGNPIVDALIETGKKNGATAEQPFPYVDGIKVEAENHKSGNDAITAICAVLKDNLDSGTANVLPSPVEKHTSDIERKTANIERNNKTMNVDKEKISEQQVMLGRKEDIEAAVKAVKALQEKVNPFTQVWQQEQAKIQFWEVNPKEAQAKHNKLAKLQKIANLKQVLDNAAETIAMLIKTNADFEEHNKAIKERIEVSFFCFDVVEK